MARAVALGAIVLASSLGSLAAPAVAQEAPNPLVRPSGRLTRQLAAPAAAQEAPPFTVEGRVQNGTAGATVSETLSVSLFAFTGERLLGSWETSTGPDGTYRFEGVADQPGATYAVAAEYQEATYSARLSRPAGSTLATQDLTVYEGTPTDPGIRFEQSALVISQESGALGAIAITEIHAVVNPTDRTFVPRADGPGGPAGLLVFGLPPNALDLNPGLGLDPGRLVQIGRGFASLAPVLPGRNEVSFSYRLPYDQASLRVERTVRYPTALFRVIAPLSGPFVESDQLAAQELMTFGERQHRTLSGGPFTPGTLVGATLSGLPVPGGPLASVPPGVAAALGAAVGLSAIGLYWTRHRRLSEAASIDETVEGILRLDEDRAQGRISGVDYQSRRQTLLDRARVLIRS